MRLNILGILILVVAGWIAVHDLASWKDVAFGDETTYLASGVTFSIPFVGGAQWGPLYAAWYAFWHLLIPDRLDLYYFNWALLSVSAGILVFVYLRAQRAAFWPSVWVAVLFLFSAQNIPLDPKISIAPFCLILTGLSVVAFFELANWKKFSFLALVALLCAYCRPEFYLSFLLATALSIWFWWQQKPVFNLANLSFLGFLLGGFLALHLLFQNPLFSGDGSRSAVAFQQHFVLNYCDWNSLPNPNTIEDQLELYHQVFGSKVESMTDALRAKPTLVCQHILTNIKNTLIANVRNAFDILHHTLLQGLHAWVRKVAAVAVLLLLLAMIDFRKTRQNWRKVSVDGVDFWSLVVLVLPTLIASVLVFPRTHYVVFHALFLFWGVAFLTRLVVCKPLPFAGPLSALALVVFLGVRCVLSPVAAPTPNADNIRFMNKLRYRKEVVSLEREWYRVFLKQSSIWIHVEQYQYCNGDFVGFVRDKGVNFILMTRDMQQYFAKDAGFAAFGSQIQKEGFIKLTTNATGEYLLVKSDFIMPPLPK